MPWEHAAEARAALNAIVTDPEHGVQVLSSPRTMSNLLKDLLPDAPREKSLLVAAAEAGLADTLREHVSHGMDPSTAIQLTASSFSDSSPLTPEACRWVTSEIAAAMGISSPTELDASGRPWGAAGQMGSDRSAGSGTVGGYSSEAPTRDYARPPAHPGDSPSARDSAQSGQGSAQAGGPAFPQAGSQSAAQADSQTAGRPGGQGFPRTSNLGYGQPPIQSNPHLYPQGQPAGFQQPAGYPQPGYRPGVPAWPGGAPQVGQKTNTLAVAALICGVVQFLGFWLLGTISAIVLGHMARNQIRQRNEQGAGLALAGLILGYVGIALTVIVVIIFIIVAVHSAPSSNY